MTGSLKVGDPAISINDLSVRYKGRSRLFGFGGKETCVLDQISLDVMHGDSLGVIGGNGAGKSTLLKVLAGLIEPDGGKISHFTQTVSLLSIQVGFVPYLSGRDNAILSGLLIGVPRDLMDAQIESIKEFSGLGRYFEEPVSCYSAGMRSRLGFSTSITIDPDVLLIDEILAVGDADFKQKSQAMIQQKIDADKTIVLVSHNPELIRKCCNRAIWIERGKLVSDGDVDEVLLEYEGR